MTQVSLDHSGEFLASSSLDGRVCVRGLLTSEHDHDADLGPSPSSSSSRLRPRPANAVSIDPIFARQGTGRRFMTGGEELVLLGQS